MFFQKVVKKEVQRNKHRNVDDARVLSLTVLLSHLKKSKFKGAKTPLAGAAHCGGGEGRGGENKHNRKDGWGQHCRRRPPTSGFGKGGGKELEKRGENREESKGRGYTL